MLAASLDVTVGETVKFAFHVTNSSAKRVELRFPSGQTHDLIVLDPQGREVWRWSSGRDVYAVHAEQGPRRERYTHLHRDLAPGAPGSYTAVALLLARISLRSSARILAPGEGRQHSLRHAAARRASRRPRQASGSTPRSARSAGERHRWKRRAHAVRDRRLIRCGPPREVDRRDQQHLSQPGTVERHRPMSRIPYPALLQRPRRPCRDQCQVPRHGLRLTTGMPARAPASSGSRSAALE